MNDYESQRTKAITALRTSGKHIENDYLKIDTVLRRDQEYWRVKRAYWLPIFPSYPIHNYDKQIFCDIGYNDSTNTMHFGNIYYPISLYPLEKVQEFSIKTWSCPNCTKGVQDRNLFPKRLINPNPSDISRDSQFEDDTSMAATFADGIGAKLYGIGSNSIGMTDLLMASVAQSVSNGLMNGALNSAGQLGSKIIVSLVDAVLGAGFTMVPFLNKMPKAKAISKFFGLSAILNAGAAGSEVIEMAVETAMTPKPTTTGIKEDIKKILSSFSMGPKPLMASFLKPQLVSRLKWNTSNFSKSPVKMVGIVPARPAQDSRIQGPVGYTDEPTLTQVRIR